MNTPNPSADEVERLATDLHELARKISWGVYPSGWEGPAHEAIIPDVTGPGGAG